MLDIRRQKVDKASSRQTREKERTRAGAFSILV